ncbi:hypothetical protein HMPREF0043_01007 [Actinobaculum sp. oral taxon 183 str. F0552]|nr:hypothetical protein HMPREF0043_01007 [Actinobaculum sp. oral taxon 183 str. F0552]
MVPSSLTVDVIDGGCISTERSPDGKAKRRGGGDLQAHSSDISC